MSVSERVVCLHTRPCNPVEKLCEAKVHLVKKIYKKNLVCIVGD